MKYLYLKLPNETVIMPTSQAYICCRNDEKIRVNHQIVGSGYTHMLEQKSKRFAELVMESLANWLAKDNPDNKAFEIDSYDDR